MTGRHGSAGGGWPDPKAAAGPRGPGPSGPEVALGPSGPGGVVLDIGGDVGALVIYCPARLDGREIEISPAGGFAATAGDPAPAGARPARMHAEVRKRLVGSEVYAAVYPGLPAGYYTIWRDAGTPVGTVIVCGGEVASYRWP